MDVVDEKVSVQEGVPNLHPWAIATAATAAYQVVRHHPRRSFVCLRRAVVIDRAIHSVQPRREPGNNKWKYNVLKLYTYTLQWRSGSTTYVSSLWSFCCLFKNFEHIIAWKLACWNKNFICFVIIRYSLQVVWTCNCKPYHFMVNFWKMVFRGFPRL